MQVTKDCGPLKKSKLGHLKRGGVVSKTLKPAERGKTRNSLEKKVALLT